MVKSGRKVRVFAESTCDKKYETKKNVESYVVDIKCGIWDYQREAEEVFLESKAF